MEKLRNAFYYFLITLLVLYVLVLAVSPEEMMNFVGFRTFIVLSDSMDPTIQENDLIIVKRIKESDLEEGDIITFNIYIEETKERNYVTHYIHEIDDTGDITKYKTIGENKLEDQYDRWTDVFGNDIDVTYYDIEGEYLFRIPYIGYIQRALSNPVFVVLIVLNGIVIYAIIKFIKKS